MSREEGRALRAAGEPAGDCIDCHQCVAVCPTGVDIRDGVQLGCIQCGLCIDACDTVMEQIGRPTGLIAYDTDINIERRRAGEPPVYQVVRPRTILYAAIIAVVGGHALRAGDPRHDGHQRAARTQPAVHAAQRWQRPQRLHRALPEQGRDRPRIRAHRRGPAAGRRPGDRRGSGPGRQQTILVGPDQTREVRVLVSSPRAALPAAPVDLTFRAVDPATGETASVRDHFIPN